MNKYDPLPGKTQRGVRTAALTMAAMGVQGAFLYRAIFDVPTFVSGMLWLGVLSSSSLASSTEASRTLV
ncbi:hypothetical protein IFT90_07195 [Frigoribacterium sp. CFBP 8766]|uniref:hypothetical protein n=1 Tax=Frigoribacterium sp. CFBP 8766 TaxID=2775273 RepID=UPI0017865091|nr:hypothetical protein [Frigoribacterium sp. CFBP 8766]MBD8584342.1 hypothetical protein [Frigoribacterium sp. CFBP 8766]